MILEGLYKSTEIKTLSLRSVDLNFTSIPKIPKLRAGVLNFYILRYKNSTPLYGAGTQPAGHFTAALAGAFAGALAGAPAFVWVVFVFFAAAT